jgi:hypothetical protein
MVFGKTDEANTPDQIQRKRRKGKRGGTERGKGNGRGNGKGKREYNAAFPIRQYWRIQKGECRTRRIQENKERERKRDTRLQRRKNAPTKVARIGESG